MSTGAAVTYSLVKKFGEGTGLIGGVWKPSALARGNYIDAMARIRKSAWAAAGGYSGPIRVQGWEDCDLWCKFVKLGFMGEFVPEILCRYRVHRLSLLQSTTNPNLDQVKLEMAQLHPWLRLEASPSISEKFRYWFKESIFSVDFWYRVPRALVTQLELKVNPFCCRL